MLIKCSTCGNQISVNAKNCPYCGEPIRKIGEGKCRNKVIGYIGIIVFISAFILPYIFQDFRFLYPFVLIGGTLMAIGFSSVTATND